MGPVLVGIVIAFFVLLFMWENHRGVLFAILFLIVAVPAGIIFIIRFLENEKKEMARQEREKREREAKEEQERKEREEQAQKDEQVRIAEQLTKANNDLIYQYGLQMGEAFRSLIPTSQGQFSVPLHSLPIANAITAKMADLWWDKELVSRNLAGDIRDRLRWGAESAGSKENPVWPKDYKGKDPHKVYLPKEWWPMFDQWVPFSFEDKDRFTHHWCLGHNGTGKTTYLRHFIIHDLERVIEGECSLIVMDSKKFIRELRGLVYFAEGGRLHDKLTLIDADEPFPLNPFCLPPAQARSVISYMLANMSGMSELQTGALAFLIDAALACHNPSLRTIRDFFALKKDEAPEFFYAFDPDTQFWFKNTFSKLHPSTREGIQQRITNFLKQNPLLDRMISADSFGLDMEEVNKDGRVLLVDTNLADFGEEGTNVFGRLIIALINQLSNRRAKEDEKKLKPVFVYIDEAQDYIRQDTMFANILEKARAQKIAMTVAHHHKGQLDPRIEASLENAGIKSECLDLGSVSVKTRRSSMMLPVQKFEFDHEDWQMHPTRYQTLRAFLRAKYPYHPAAAPRLSPVSDDDQPLTQKF